MVRVAPLLLALSCGTAPALADGSNSCAQATPIGDGTFTGSTVGATNDGSASCGSSSTTPDVWFLYQAPASGVLSVDTCGSAYDTVLSVHSACPGTTGNELACNDDTCSVQSAVSIEVMAQEDYLIRVSGWMGSIGSFTLNVSLESDPTGDECADAIPITPGTWMGSTATATNDGSATCGVSNKSPDVWFSYTADGYELVSAQTCGTNWDTVLSVHSGCPGTADNQVNCNDDFCSFQSRVQFSAEPGQEFLIRVAGWQGATGPFTLALSATDTIKGADVLVGDMIDMDQFGRVGDVVACAVDSPVCNAGIEPLDWFELDQPNHPFINANMYRLHQGRLEQIGQSWVKHGFAAAQEDTCGLGCVPHPDPSRLGVGCSDTYGAFINASQAFLAPRHEVNPFTGAWSFVGSHLEQGSHAHNPIEHRLQLHDDDLDPALHPGAQYLIELHVLAHDDFDHTNSIGHEPIGVSGAPGGTWTFDLSGASTEIGPAIMAWPDATVTVIPEDPAGDGRVYLASRVTAVEGGGWHYEYAIFNLDLDRGVRSFSVPVGQKAVSGIGFKAVASHDEPYTNDPWTASVAGEAITWSTAGYEQDPASNPIRWGTMYNFWFDIDAPPANVVATLGLYKPGAPGDLSGVTTGPMVGLTGDVNADGLVNVEDMIAVFLGWGPCPAPPAVCPADVDGDGAVAVGDLVLVVLNWS
jgi:hypothetical protein